MYNPTHLVINQLFSTIVLPQQLHELHDIRIICIKLIAGPIEAHDKSAIVVIRGDDGREPTWIDRVLPPHGGWRLIFCQYLRGRTCLNGGVRECPNDHCGVVHGSRRGEHGGFLDVVAQIHTAICA